MALLIVTALIVGKSAQGYPNGGVSGGDEWAADSIENGCSCHMDEQLNEGMYMLDGNPAKYVPDTTYNVSLIINDTNKLAIIYSNCRCNCPHIIFNWYVGSAILK